MKHLIFFTWAVIITIMWFIFMIIGFVFRTIWDFNPKKYKFTYYPSKVIYNSKQTISGDMHAAWTSPYYDYSEYYDTYSGANNKNTIYRTYFHYIWNIKPRNYEN